MMGATAKEENSGSKDGMNDSDEAFLLDECNPYKRLDNETRDSYNSLANMMENSSMNSIMSIFAEKILMNLVY